jgi:hypothetical protein
LFILFILFILFQSFFSFSPLIKIQSYNHTIIQTRMQTENLDNIFPNIDEKFIIIDDTKQEFLNSTKLLSRSHNNKLRKFHVDPLYYKNTKQDEKQLIKVFEVWCKINNDPHHAQTSRCLVGKILPKIHDYTKIVIIIFYLGRYQIFFYNKI